MNGLIPPVACLPGPPPLGTYLTAAQLAPYSDAAAIITAAHEQARTLVEQAQQVLHKAQQDAARVRDDAYREGVLSAETEIERRRATVIEETVQWLIDAHLAEVHVARRLDARIRTLVASVVEPYLGAADAVELLTQRVLECLASELRSHVFRVYVSPANSAQVSDALRDDQRVQVESDAKLSERAARLETENAIVNFDIDLHLSALLTLLNTTSSENCSDAQSA
ncbi:hypothetical protein DIE19_33715 [Burkholderia sp. Bp9126]|nr:hypothetical protein DIE19_33715 [Burkholderia sp. Bp9126]